MESSANYWISSRIGFHTATYLCDKNYKAYAGVLDLEQESDKLKNATINPHGLVLCGESA